MKSPLINRRKQTRQVRAMLAGNSPITADRMTPKYLHKRRRYASDENESEGYVCRPTESLHVRRYDLVIEEYHGEFGHVHRHVVEACFSVYYSGQVER